MSQDRFDVLDEGGNATRKTATETEVHRQELWHRSVNLCITDRRGGVPPHVHILLDSWDFPVAGHVLAGELPAEAVAREMPLQLGIKLPLCHLRRMGLLEVGKTRSEYWVADERYRGDGYIHRVVEYNLILPWPSFDEQKLQLNKDKITEMRWVSVGQIREEVKYPDKLERFGYAYRGPDEAKLYSMMLDAAREQTARHAGR